MVAVAVLSMDLALIRWADDLASSHQFPASYAAVGILACVLVPSVSLLAVAAANAALGLARRGRASPFATGYLICGSLVTFAFCLDLAAQTYLLLGVTTVREPAPETETSVVGSRAGEALEVAIYALPQVVCAMIGGLLAARYRLTIVLGVRRPLPDTGVPPQPT
jgi:hypothetical protein